MKIFIRSYSAFLTIALALSLLAVPAIGQQRTSGQQQKGAAPSRAPGAQKKASPAAAKAIPPKETLEEILSQPDAFTAVRIAGQGGEVLVTRKGNMYRTETEQSGFKITKITRPDLKKSFTLRIDKKLYNEASLENRSALLFDPFNLTYLRTLAPRNLKTEFLGEEFLDGVKCKKYRFSFDEVNQVKTIAIWKAADLQGLIIKQEQEFFGAKSTFELKNAKLEFAADLFDVPKDFKKVEDPADMFKPAPQTDQQ